jgi:ATP phosphoribosyltransferase regulatory subunit
MDVKRWLLPEGIDELLPDQAAILEQLRRELLDLYASWGYRLVITPFVEYLDSLLSGVEQDLSLQTVKLTDQISGRLLGIRADITPQAARIDAHKLQQQMPTRLCYIGSVLRAYPDSQSGSRSPLQIGAELYGHAGIESDHEILELMLATLRLSGLQDIYLDLGHVGIYRALAEYAGLNHEQEYALFAAMQRKARPEISQLLENYGLSGPASEMLNALADLNGDATILAQARETLAPAPDTVHAAIDYLQQLGQQTSVPVHYDLAELRAYQYQTGVVFAAFAPGQGAEIARGGRYDHIGEAFGRARPATGFSADLKNLMALNKQPLTRQPVILAPAVADADLEKQIIELRTQGKTVIRELPGQADAISELGITHTLQQNDAGWRLVNC